MLRRLLLPALLVLTTLAVLTAPITGPAAAAASPWGPRPPHNPYVAASSSATMHGDASSSKAFGHRGPGTDVTVTRGTLGAACPTILAGSDQLPVALCTRIVDRKPVLNLLDPDSTAVLATQEVATGTLLGGVYAYLDHRNRLVIVDGNRQLQRYAHVKATDGSWSFKAADPVDLTSVIPADDGVTGVTPDWQGRVWFATDDGRVGTVTGTKARVLALPRGERIANSISSSPSGVAVTSTHAVYLFRAGAKDQPVRLWRKGYNRSTARKPGQLSWGSGATPVFFGPKKGYEYVAVTDNRRPHPNLLVLRTASRGTAGVVCKLPVLTKAAQSGTEDAPTAVGRSVFVTSTYGYPYPAYPEDAGDSSPTSADFVGGQTRVDVRADGSGCVRRWDNLTKSAGMPRLSTTEGRIYTVVKGGALGTFRAATINARTGSITSQTIIGGPLADPLQMTGMTLRDGTLYQGNITGYVRVDPR